MKNKLKQYLKDERGVTSIEYSMLLAGLGLAVMSGAFLIGDDLANVFVNLTGVLEQNPGFRGLEVE